MKKSDLKKIKSQASSHKASITKKVMLSYREVANITTFAQGRFPPGETVEPHSHADMAEIFLVQSGTGTLIVEQQEEELRPGVCIAVEAGETHSLLNSGQKDLVLTYFAVEYDPQD